jgi:hypothetical protein
MVVVGPLPVEVTEPGERVRVHVPVAGKPLSGTLPVATEHVGWTIAPTTGAVGVRGWTGISAFAEFGDVHPAAFVTV